MIDTDREKIIYRYQAAWPRPMGNATLALWSEHLSKMDYAITVKALGILERTTRHQPSIAELYEAYGAAKPTAVTKAVEAPIDVSGRKRIHDMVEAFKNRDETQIVTETMLDKAGVAHWRERLRDAREDDERRGSGARENYDLAWLNIKNELRGGVRVEAAHKAPRVDTRTHKEAH